MHERDAQLEAARQAMQKVTASQRAAGDESEAIEDLKRRANNRMAELEAKIQAAIKERDEARALVHERDKQLEEKIASARGAARERRRGGRREEVAAQEDDRGAR